jgi:integrase
MRDFVSGAYRVEAPALACLADLVRPEAIKAILRHYHSGAGGKPNAFAVGVSKTLIDVARYHVRVGEERLRELKAIAAKLPAIPYELTEKNKELLRRLENEQTRARLVFMPDVLMRKAEAELRRGHLPFVEAQVAIAVDILLVAPLRPQNLIGLDWLGNLKEPHGPKGKLLLYIPKEQTKTKKRELTFEIPDETARKIRWYRQEIMPRLGADRDGHLFVSEGGGRKEQETLTGQIIEKIAEHVGIHMTPHQFRHVAAALYLEEHPEDFQTVTDLLGHAWIKTTLIYAGSSSRRASKAYCNMLLRQRDALKLKRGRRRKA